jgi:hypothetical protein
MLHNRCFFFCCNVPAPWGVDSPFVGEANWAGGGCSWLFLAVLQYEYNLNRISCMPRQHPWPNTALYGAQARRVSIVDSDARYQTIRVVPGRCSKELGCSRYGIDDISVRCSILRLYESCRTSSAFCVEFEFQKLLRYGPEVLGGMALHGMAWQLLLHTFLARERTRWRTGVLDPF